jgi:hypothetical protein
VVSCNGDLLAYGMGWPPEWCETAAAAEAWALLAVLRQCPFPPMTKTDCMSLLSTAVAGSARATHHSRPLARVWRAIDELLGGDISTLVRESLLVWMPAHQSLLMVGVTKLSSGGRLTVIDWRANRLVDALAKAAAREQQVSRDTVAFLASAEVAAGHAAALLGVVTHAANNHTDVELLDDGTTRSRVLRDSVDKPKVDPAPPSGASAPAAAAPATAAQPCARSEVAPWRAPTAAGLARRRRADVEATALAACVERIGSGLTARPRALSGTERIVAIAARLATRQPSLLS